MRPSYSCNPRPKGKGLEGCSWETPSQCFHISLLKRKSIFMKSKEKHKVHSDILNFMIWPWNSFHFLVVQQTLLTLRVHNLINSWRWISGSDIAVKSFTSSGEKYRFAKAKILLLVLRCFSSTSIPIYNQKHKQQSLNCVPNTLFTYLVCIFSHNLAITLGADLCSPKRRGYLLAHPESLHRLLEKMCVRY